MDECVEIHSSDEKQSTIVDEGNSLDNSNSENHCLEKSSSMENTLRNDYRVENYTEEEVVYDPGKIDDIYNSKVTAGERNLEMYNSDAQIFYSQVVKLENEMEYAAGDSVNQPLSYQDLNLIYMDETLHICNICDKTFAKKSNLTRHYLNHTGENSFCCDHCEAKFPTATRLDEHSCSHSGIKPHVCGVCNKTFARTSNLTRHYATHDGVKVYKCDLCEGRFLDSSRLKEHYQTHVGEKRFACDMCDKRFLKKYNLKRHYRTHTGEHPHTCEICGRGYSKRLYLLLHVNNHAKETAKAEMAKKRDSKEKDINDERYMDNEEEVKVLKNNEEEIDVKAAVISEEKTGIEVRKKSGGGLLSKNETIKNDVTGKKNDLEEERVKDNCDAKKDSSKIIKSCESDIKSYEEDFIKEENRSPSALETFDQTQMNLPDVLDASSRLINTPQPDSDQITCSQNLFSCKKCNKHFIKENSYIMHLKSHVTKEPIRCKVCKATFTHGSRLKEHFVTHSGEKAFVCTVCGRQFSRNSNLIRHLATHTGERRYKCDVCQKLFCSATRLKEHGLSHTGEKPHHCSVCGRFFRHKNGLRRHLLTHTGEKPYKCSLCAKRFSRKKSLNFHLQKHRDRKETVSKTSSKAKACISKITKSSEPHLSEGIHEPGKLQTSGLTPADRTERNGIKTDDICHASCSPKLTMSTNAIEKAKTVRKTKSLNDGRSSISNKQNVSEYKVSTRKSNRNASSELPTVTKI